MINNSKLKYILSFAVVFILLILGVFYSVKFYPEKPYQVITPENYPAGTTVSLYKNTPPSFPKEVVLENKTLNYSGTVASPQGKTQITVSYISDQNMKDLTDLYTKSLPSVGWNVAQTSVYPKVSIIRVTKGGQSVLITIAPLQKTGGGTMVTFQYEK